MRWKAPSLAIVLSMGLAACGGNSTTGPSTYPNVAGTYSGSVVIALSGLGVSLTCPATTTVTQSGANVTLSPATLSGTCSGLPSVPLGNLTINPTGSLATTTEKHVFEASCNGYFDAATSGGFSGSSFQFSFSLTATSGGCVSEPGSFSVTGTLSR